MRAHEWLGTCARGRWPVGPPDDCLSAAQSAASPTGSIPPRPRRNRQTGIRPATRSDGPGFDSALTFYITASVLPLGAVRRDRQRHVPVTRRAGTLCTSRGPIGGLGGYVVTVRLCGGSPGPQRCGTNQYIGADHATKQGHEGRRYVAPVGPIRLQLALEVVYEGRSRLPNGGQVRTWAMLPRSGPFGHALVRIKSGRKPGFTEFKSH